jgi:hypothetical protein
MVEVPVVQAGPAEPHEAPREDLRRLLLMRSHARMLDCGHDEGAGDLSCAFRTSGEPAPAQPERTLHVFVTDPPGLLLAATDFDPAGKLGEHDVVVADCAFDQVGAISDVRLGAAKGIEGYLYGAPLAAGKARACTFEPFAGLPEHMRAAHIVVMHDRSRRKPDDVTRTRQDAIALTRRIQHESLTMTELAERYSDEPGAGPRGGELGVFRRGAMVPEFELVLLSTKIGERSPMFETSFGFHILERHAP